MGLSLEPPTSVLLLKPIGEVGEFVFGQSIDKVVHDDVGEVHILASRVIEVIAANGKGITIPTEHKSVQIRAESDTPVAKGKARP